MKSFFVPSVASLLLFAAPAVAQGSILPYLPKDTVMAMAVPDLSMSMAQFAKMPLAKMWAEEEVQTFIADLKELAHKQIEKGMAQAKEMHAQGALSFDPQKLTELRVQGGSFAITSLAMGMGDFGPLPKLGFVLHLDFGASAPTWNALIQMGIGMLEAKAGDEMVKKESKVGDVQLLSYTANDATGIEMGLNIAMVPNGVLIGTLASDLTTIVENMNGKTPALGASARYQASAKHINVDGAELEVFMAFDPMVEFGTSLIKLAIEQGGAQGVDMDGIGRAIDAMGFRNLGAMGATSSYVDGKCVDRSFRASDGAGKTIAAKTIDTAFLKWVPKESVGFSAGTMDVMSIYDALRRGLEAYDPNMAKQLLEQLGQMEKQLGFNIRDDFFGSLGDHYITWSMPMGTISSPPEVAMLLKVASEEKLVNVLKNLAKLTNGMVEIEQGEKRGLMAYQIRVNFDPMQGMGGMNPFDMFQPTFAFKNGYMVLGFSASDVKRVFQRMDREDDPKGDIRSNKEFAAIAASIPQGVDSLTFTDWKSNFESLYQLATGLLAFVPLGEEVPIDMSLLPDSATLTKHLFGAVSYSKTDANGTTGYAVGPWGPEVGLLLGGAIIFGTGLVGMSRGF